MKLSPRKNCTGCAACRDVCSVGAVSMVADEEGFPYPVIDASKCVGCGRCRAVCPALAGLKPRTPQRSLAVRARDLELRTASSSGGVFSLLAERVLSSGGVVFGAVWTRDWNVVHAKAETLSELAAMRGSKYLQSNLEGVYAEVRAELAKGRRVMFTGTPCQVAALKRFLRGDDSGLLAVEIMCHAAVSPKAWHSYLRARGEEWKPGSGSGDVASGIVGVTFRDKSAGWSKSAIRLTFADGKVYRCGHHDDFYMCAYGAHLSTRPSCHACRMRGFRSGADVTMGDFWGVGDHHPELMDDRGVSAVFVHTTAGREAVEAILGSCDFTETEPERVAVWNRILYLSAKAHSERHEFLCRVGDENFDRLFLELVHRPRKSVFRRIFERIFKRGGAKS